MEIATGMRGDQEEYVRFTNPPAEISYRMEHHRHIMETALDVEGRAWVRSSLAYCSQELSDPLMQRLIRWGSLQHDLRILIGNVFRVKLLAPKNVDRKCGSPTYRGPSSDLRTLSTSWRYSEEFAKLLVLWNHGVCWSEETIVRGGGVDSAAAASTRFHICSSVDAFTIDILSSGLIRSRSKSFDATADMSRSRLLRTIPPELDGRRRAVGRI